MSRGAATDVREGGLRLTPQPKICRPSGAFCIFVVLNLGLTPQAKYLSRLRRSVPSSAPHPRFLGRHRGKTLSSSLGNKCLEPRSGDRYIAWGVSPRIPAPNKIISRGAATDVRAVGLRLTPQSKICRPSGLSVCLSSWPWGSRPRLNICRASGAPFGNQRSTHNSSENTEEASP